MSGKSMVEKIWEAQGLTTPMKVGEEMALQVHQTLTHDVTGTQAYLAFETLDIEKVRTELSVSYIDHNLLYADNKNPDDHVYLQTVAEKYGIVLSRAGNGICHIVHMERFGIPGKVLLGSDSHTPTGGAIGMLAIGAGGLDVAMAMAGEPLYLRVPKRVRVRLIGNLPVGSSAKDVALEMLRRYGVKGGLGRIFEYEGEGVRTLSVFERATIANMGAEMGATTSIFPSDEQVREFFASQNRLDEWVPLQGDEDAVYDEELTLDLGQIRPMVAQPDMPDKVISIQELKERVYLDQVFIGSCTNASYADFVKAAKIMKGKTVHPRVSLVIAPGSRQIFTTLLENGIITSLVQSGARILECGCGPCVGIGQAPRTKGISLRTSNRNFKGRSGTLESSIYLGSPETAAASAITGYITDPSTLEETVESVKEPGAFDIHDNLLLYPPVDGAAVTVVRGPNIKAMPINTPLPEELEVKVGVKWGDNITTDDIIPANAQFSALRSNIPAISAYTFGRIDPEFATRAKEYGACAIVGGENYGQGSSREHAAIAPMYLGVKFVLVKSLARIHKNNLINHGVLPLVFQQPQDWNKVEQGDILSIGNSKEQLWTRQIQIENKTKGVTIMATIEATDREIAVLIAGGRLRYRKDKK